MKETLFFIILSMILGLSLQAQAVEVMELNLIRAALSDFRTAKPYFDQLFTKVLKKEPKSADKWDYLLEFLTEIHGQSHASSYNSLTSENKLISVNWELLLIYESSRDGIKVGFLEDIEDILARFYLSFPETADGERILINRFLNEENKKKLIDDDLLSIETYNAIISKFNHNVEILGTLPSMILQFEGLIKNPVDYLKRLIDHIEADLEYSQGKMGELSLQKKRGESVKDLEMLFRFAETLTQIQRSKLTETLLQRNLMTKPFLGLYLEWFTNNTSSHEINILQFLSREASDLTRYKVKELSGFLLPVENMVYLFKTRELNKYHILTLLQSESFGNDFFKETSFVAQTVFLMKELVESPDLDHSVERYRAVMEAFNSLVGDVENCLTLKPQLTNIFLFVSNSLDKQELIVPERMFGMLKDSAQIKSELVLSTILESYYYLQEGKYSAHIHYDPVNLGKDGENMKALRQIEHLSQLNHGMGQLIGLDSDSLSFWDRQRDFRVSMFGRIFTNLI